MYTLYLDESGTDDITNTHLEDYRFLSLSGAIMRKEVANGEATRALNEIKRDVFGTEDIIFHRKKIMTRYKQFDVLKNEDKNKKFCQHLRNYISQTKYQLITVGIDKRAMLRKTHWAEKDPYHYCMGLMVEKYTQWLERQGNKTGDMIFESRGGEKDISLGEKYERIYKQGYVHNAYVSVNRIQRAITCDKLSFAKKTANIAGLQLVDLIANPSWKYVMSKKGHANVKLQGETKVIVDILEKEKYDRNQLHGWIDGYGMKYLP